MTRIFRAVKGYAGGVPTDVLEWYSLDCGHIASRRKTVLDAPKKMYCGKCSRIASNALPDQHGPEGEECGQPKKASSPDATKKSEPCKTRKTRQPGL